MLVKSLQNFTLLAFCLHSVCDIFKLQKPGGKAWLFLYPEKKEGGPHEEHQKTERERKTLRRLRMARQENGNTPLRTATLHIRGTKPRRDKVKRYGEVQPGFVARCMGFAVDCKRQPAQLLHKPRMETPAAGSIKTPAPPLLGLRTQSAGGE